LYVGGSIPDASQVPVVFNEAQDRGLIGDLVIHVVLPGIGRNDEQRRTWSVTAAALGGGIHVGAAEADARQRVVGDLRLVDERIHHVVVPAIGIVVGDDDRGVFPQRARLQGIDGAHHELLLVERIGVARVSIK